MSSGIYAISCADGSFYIGESKNVETRQSVKWASIFGLRYEIVRLMPNSTKREHLKAELEVAREYRDKGFNVVSLTIEDIVKKALAGQTESTRKKLSIAGRKGAEAQSKVVTLSQRREWGRIAGIKANVNITEKQREARRKNGRKVGLTGIGRATQLAARAIA